MAVWLTTVNGERYELVMREGLEDESRAMSALIDGVGNVRQHRTVGEADKSRASPGAPPSLSRFQQSATVAVARVQKGLGCASRPPRRRVPLAPLSATQPRARSQTRSAYAHLGPNAR